MHSSPLETLQQARVHRVPVEKPISVRDTQVTERYTSRKDIIHHEANLAGMTNNMSLRN